MLLGKLVHVFNFPVAELVRSVWTMMLPQRFISRLVRYFRSLRASKLFRSALEPYLLLCHLISNVLYWRQHWTHEVSINKSVLVEEGTCPDKDPGLHEGWTPKDFSNPNYERISESELIEEETLPGYQAEWYYPVRIGEIIASRYQIIGKLGFGRTSTVWLARDLNGCRHVCLKICILSSVSESYNSQEIAAYERLEHGPENHPGRRGIRALLDHFVIAGPDGEHRCFVHPPLWGNIANFLRLDPDVDRLFPPILAFVLKQLFLTLDYARECEVIHTDISPSNVMFTIKDPTALEMFEKAELEYPSPRKEMNGRFIYLSHAIGDQDKAECFPVLCDFGHAVWGGEKHSSAAQPDLYRSPEVTLQVPWSYEIDVWSVACLIWDVFEGTHLFDGTDGECDAIYRSHVHLAEMIAYMGPPPHEFIAQGSVGSKFFSPEGELVAGVEARPPTSLDSVETTLKVWAKDDKERDLFLRLMGKMLEWDPESRQTPKQLLEDKWIR
ncbi:hypothetical protein C0993_009585, partial [Termitomyces sp. T159_Od127]